jgi:deoxycytidylate deaminase
MCSKLIIECEVKLIIFDKDYQSENAKLILKKSNCIVNKWSGGFDKYFYDKETDK